MMKSELPSTSKSTLEILNASIKEEPNDKQTGENDYVYPLNLNDSIKQEFDEDASAFVETRINLTTGENFFPLHIKTELPDDNDSSEMVDNGCTNRDCNLNKHCSSNYKCKKCDLIFNEKQVFLMHYEKCNTATIQQLHTAPSTSITQYRQDVDKLVKLIPKFSCLYNTNNKDHGNVQFKELIWDKIATICGFPTGVAAEKAWIKIKEGFCQVLQQHNETNTFKYRKQLEFLIPFLNVRSNQQNPTITDSNLMTLDVANLQSGQVGVTPAKKAKVATTNNDTSKGKKRQRDNHSEVWRKNTQVCVHPLDMFFRSMCETTKNLPFHLQLNVKKRVFEAVIDAEEMAAVENNSQRNNLCHTSANSNLEECNHFPFMVENVENNSTSDED